MRFCFKDELNKFGRVESKNLHSSGVHGWISVLSGWICTTFYGGSACYTEESQKICFRQMLVSPRSAWRCGVSKIRVFGVNFLEKNSIRGKHRRRTKPKTAHTSHFNAAEHHTWSSGNDTRKSGKSLKTWKWPPTWVVGFGKTIPPTNSQELWSLEKLDQYIKGARRAPQRKRFDGSSMKKLFEVTAGKQKLRPKMRPVYPRFGITLQLTALRIIYTFRFEKLKFLMKEPIRFPQAYFSNSVQGHSLVHAKPQLDP